MTCQDYRSRANLWKQSRHALDFFKKYSIPFWAMSNKNDGRLSDDNWLMGDSNDDILVLYLKPGGSGSVTVDLSPSAQDGDAYLVDWYDPRNGGSLQRGTVQALPAKKAQSVGKPPNNQEKDWVILFQKCAGCIPTEGKDTALIAGLVVACVVALAFAFLYIRERKRMVAETKRAREPGSGLDTETADDTERPVADAVASHRTSDSATVYAVAYAAVDVEADAALDVEANASERPLPDYKDQVRPERKELEEETDPASAEANESGRSPPEYKDQTRSEEETDATGENMDAPKGMDPPEGRARNKPSASFIDGYRMQV